MIKVQKWLICNRYGYKIFDIKFNLKIIYNNINSTSLVVKKIKL